MSNPDVVALLERSLDAIRAGTVTSGNPQELSYTKRALDTMQDIRRALESLKGAA